jgi:glutathione peroxidase-family protein
MLTPAFSEEEDLTQQFRAKGAKMLMVPNDGFEHAGSGSHLNLREIEYMNKSINKANLLARNLHYVRSKWKGNVEF